MGHPSLATDKDLTNGPALSQGVSEKCRASAFESLASPATAQPPARLVCRPARVSASPDPSPEQMPPARASLPPAWRQAWVALTRAARSVLGQPVRPPAVKPFAAPADSVAHPGTPLPAWFPS